MEEEGIYKDEILKLFNVFEALDKEGVLLREKYPTDLKIFLNSVLDEEEITTLKTDLAEIFPDQILDSSEEISISTGSPFFHGSKDDFVYDAYKSNSRPLYNYGYINVQYGRRCGMEFKFFRLNTFDNFVIVNFYKWEENDYDRSPIVDRYNEKYRKLFCLCNNIVSKRIWAYSVKDMT